MSKYCSDCVNLDTNNAKCDGVYKCKLINDFTNTSNCSCEKFEKSYGRNSLEKQKLYDLGKKSKDIAKNLTSQELDSVKGLLKAYREFEKTGELPKTNEQDLSK